jgi:2,3-bisphosphoglycerate-independent phosphoglycerate mutase
MNRIPFLVAAHGEYKDTTLTLRDGELADVAPTLLHIIGLPQPKEMTGKSLIVTSLNRHQFFQLSS